MKTQLSQYVQAQRNACLVLHTQKDVLLLLQTEQLTIQLLQPASKKPYLLFTSFVP